MSRTAITDEQRQQAAEALPPVDVDPGRGDTLAVALAGLSGAQLVGLAQAMLARAEALLSGDEEGQA